MFANQWETQQSINLMFCFSLFAWFALLKQNAFSECQLWSRLRKSSFFFFLPCFCIEAARYVKRFAFSLTSCSQGSIDVVVELVSSYISEMRCSAYWNDDVLCGSARRIPALLWISHLLCYCTFPLYYSYCFFHSHFNIFLSNIFLSSSSLSIPANLHALPYSTCISCWQSWAPV